MLNWLRLTQLITVATVFAAPAYAQSFRDVVDTFLQAEIRFDPATMRSVMCPEYIEISPVGDIDRLDQVLSFYKPEAHIDMRLVDSSVLESTDINSSPLLVEKLHYRATVDHKPRDVTFIASFLGQLKGRELTVCRVQYTAYRPKPPSARQ